MQTYLQLFVIIPLAAFLISLVLPPKKEFYLSTVAITTMILHTAGLIVFSTAWLINGHPLLDSKHFVFISAGDIEIFLDFYFDKTTAVFALVGALLTLVVTIFSKYYMHREEGFKRFFCTVLLFFAGYNITVFGGNFETLFIGWEILGITSFLLIAFYRDRFLPVKNGLKTISLYRLGDICLLLAMWMSHHLWHENITFIKLNDSLAVQQHLQEHNWYAILLAGAIAVAAMIKSAQLPFSSWLPRAMEGPTTSSAIFYGSLSVHIGVFLLLRTYPYWESLVFIKILLVTIGVLTAIIATGIAKVQSTVKTQIAYSSVAQIGLIFIEVALGLHVLALIHFAGNAFLRTYQLLVSPSVLSYLIHDMFFSFKAQKHQFASSFTRKLKNTMYILSIKEWNLDFYLFRFLWSPFKLIGNKLSFFSGVPALLLLAALFLTGLYVTNNRGMVSPSLVSALPFLYSVLGLLLILKSFAERGDAIKGWLFIIAGQLNVMLSVTLFSEDFAAHVLLYLSGSALAAIIGYLCLVKIKNIDKDIQLNRYHGYSYERPVTGFVFLLACLALAGLPITPTFIGIDLLFSHIHKNEGFLILFTSLSFLFVELSILRIYSRIFLGQHKKGYHPIAFKYS